MKSKCWMIAGAALCATLVAVSVRPAEALVSCGDTVDIETLDGSGFTADRVVNGLTIAHGEVAAGGASGSANLIWQLSGSHYTDIHLECRDWQTGYLHNKYMYDSSTGGTGNIVYCDFHGGAYDQAFSAYGRTCLP